MLGELHEWKDEFAEMQDKRKIHALQLYWNIHAGGWSCKHLPKFKMNLHVLLVSAFAVQELL